MSSSVVPEAEVNAQMVAAISGDEGSSSSHTPNVPPNSMRDLCPRVKRQLSAQGAPLRAKWASITRNDKLRLLSYVLLFLGTVFALNFATAHGWAKVRNDMQPSEACTISFKQSFGLSSAERLIERSDGCTSSIIYTPESKIQPYVDFSYSYNDDDRDDRPACYGSSPKKNSRFNLLGKGLDKGGSDDPCRFYAAGEITKLFLYPGFFCLLISFLASIGLTCCPGTCCPKGCCKCCCMCCKDGTSGWTIAALVNIILAALAWAVLKHDDPEDPDIEFTWFGPTFLGVLLFVPALLISAIVILCKIPFVGTAAGQVAPAMQQQQLVSVVVPPGAAPGQLITVTVNGQNLQVAIPAGLKEGMSFQIQAPAAPVVLNVKPANAGAEVAEVVAPPVKEAS